MSFTSNTFLFIFLPFTVIFHYFLPMKVKNIFLILMSLIFFIWLNPKLIVVLIFSILTNYIIGNNIIKKEGQIKWLSIGIVINLVLLFYYKYTDFFISILNGIFHVQIEIKEIMLPIGISFFTFSGISYLIDLYFKKIDNSPNLIDVALYISFFPKLLQGPITRFNQIKSNIDNRGITTDMLVMGIQRCIIGLAEKTIIADSLGKVVDSIWFAGPNQITSSIAWLGSICYTLQIYFDFAGYTNMAIGIAKMLGFNLPENFDFPYISKSITEFWRRWHITLGSFFRDYVYIPLGGNRKGISRTYVNLIIVFFLTGLWHGASWHFIAWGLFNGLFMLIERGIKQSRFSFSIIPKRIKSFILHVYALFVINLSWVLFRANNMSSAIRYIKIMLGIEKTLKPPLTVGWYLNRWNIFVLIVAIILASDFIWKILKKQNNKNCVFKMSIKFIFLLCLLFISLMKVISGSYSSFIYFQF